MLHQENSEVFVRHHSEQLACGNLRGRDDGRSNFLPEKYHIATEWNATACQVSTASAVKEVTVDHNKRPACNGFPDMVDWKRMKREDQTISEKDHHVADADVNVPEYRSYMTCERTFDPPAYGSQETEDEEWHPSSCICFPLYAPMKYGHSCWSGDSFRYSALSKWSAEVVSQYMADVFVCHRPHKMNC